MTDSLKCFNELLDTLYWNSIYLLFLNLLILHSRNTVFPFLKKEKERNNEKCKTSKKTDGSHHSVCKLGFNLSETILIYRLSLTEVNAGHLHEVLTNENKTHLKKIQIRIQNHYEKYLSRKYKRLYIKKTGLCYFQYEVESKEVINVQTLWWRLKYNC